MDWIRQFVEEYVEEHPGVIVILGAIMLGLAALTGGIIVAALTGG